MSYQISLVPFRRIEHSNLPPDKKKDLIIKILLMLEVVHEAKYIYFHSNEAIYLNILALFQNMELQIIGTWVHLSKYLLFVNSLSLFKLFNEERAMQKTQAYVKHTI